MKRNVPVYKLLLIFTANIFGFVLQWTSLCKFIESESSHLLNSLTWEWNFYTGVCIEFAC